MAAVLAAYVAVSSGWFLNRFIEPAHERWVSQFDQLPISPGDTVFLGDSLTEGGAWPEWFPGAPVRNRGIDGDVTTGVLARLDQVVEGRPGQVFLMIGTNDLAAGASATDIVANVRNIVDQILADSPGTEVYVQSVLPRAVGYRAEIESLNGQLLAAVDDAAHWIDLYPLFLDEDGSISDVYSNDELHLNGQGYRVWRDAIRPYVTAG